MTGWQGKEGIRVFREILFGAFCLRQHVTDRGKLIEFCCLDLVSLTVNWINVINKVRSIKRAIWMLETLNRFQFILIDYCNFTGLPYESSSPKSSYYLV